MLSGFPVVAVVEIERAALSLDFAVPGNGDLVVPCEPGFAIREVPFGIEVARSDPGRRFRRVPALGPSPQLRVDMVIRPMERLLRSAMPVVVRSPPDERVEFTDDLAGGGLTVSAQVVMDGTQVPHHLASLGRRQDYAPVSAHAEAEEVEAVVDVDDPGLCLAQLQSTLFQKRRQHRDNMPFQDLAGRCRHHQIIGIAYQTNAAVETATMAWANGSAPVVLGSEEPFHAVEGDVG
jgi:hypothetical protein